MSKHHFCNGLKELTFNPYLNKNKVALKPQNYLITPSSLKVRLCVTDTTCFTTRDKFLQQSNRLAYLQNCIINQPLVLWEPD